ncbi:hypothetical protein LCGC14_1994810 [marine sediment metagenome]|uniref:Uncharacterized protein n=1 Tax=marine sediment metagenome TaxID=412755 RepID=A0A0F9FT23_9ZZZZ
MKQLILIFLLFTLISCEPRKNNTPLIVTQIRLSKNIGTPKYYIIILNRDIVVVTTTNYKIGDTLK